MRPPVSGSGGEISGQREGARLATALFGHVIWRDRMRLPVRSTAVSVFGDLDVDLRAAAIEGGEISVTVVAVVGNIDIYVPEGVSVVVAGIAVMGHRRDWGREAGRADAPVLRVRVVGLGGTVDVWRVPAELRDSSYTEVIRELRLRSQPQPLAS